MRYDIAVIRFLCIALVVFFHAYGMTYANHLPQETGLAYKYIYQHWVEGGPIFVAMPMFVFISGFLFGGQLMKSQPITFARMLKSKLMRLILPFFFFTVFFMFTTDSVSWEPFYKWNYWHLWFLPMLFWCFIITYLMRPLIMSTTDWVSSLTLLVLFAISLIGKFMPPFIGLHNVHQWFCWFALGACFFRHESMLDKKSIKIQVTIFGAAAYLLLSVCFPQEYGTNSVMSHIISICGMAALWCGINLINWRDGKFTSILIGLSGASFGIYIFHNWIEMHMLSNTARRYLPIDGFASQHTLIFPLLFSLIAFGISYAISMVLLKTKIGKNLIG